MDAAGTSPGRLGSLARVVAPKVLQFVFVIWATYTVTFLLIHALPGDPLLAALSVRGGDATTVDPAQLDALRERYGMSGSVFEQYVARLFGTFSGDLGVSLATGQPVADSIARALPNTAAVAGLALAIGVVIAVLITFLAHVAKWQWLRQTLLQIPPLGVAVPAFLTGLVLISVFAFGLHWLPSSGDRTPLSVILPAVTLSLPVGAIFFQVFSAAVSEAETSPYVFTAVAKGLRPRTVFTKHILRNALLPSITVIALLVGYLAGGTAVVETVFSRDGIGRLTVDAVVARDTNVVQGVIIVVAVIFATVTLLVDLAYGLIDPRLRRRLVGTRTRAAITEAGAAS